MLYHCLDTAKDRKVDFYFFVGSTIKNRKIKGGIGLKTNIAKGDLWSQIIKRKEVIYSENRNTWTPQTFDDYPGVEVEYATKTWMSNVVSKARLENMRDGDSLFLVGQTGCGKSTLYQDLVIPLAHSHGKKVLYLANRTALCMQMKNNCIKNKFVGELPIGKRKVKDLKRILSDEGLNEQIDFSAVDVLSYQKFLRIHNDLDFTSYDYVCMDEVHAFLSDSFNPTMEEILNILSSKTTFSKKIFLTATPQECISNIYNSFFASNSYNLRGGRKFSVIVMDHDYSYLKPIFFSKTKEIINLITEKRGEMFLVFVRNKAVGQQIQDELIQRNIHAEMFTADSDKESFIYKEIVSNEKMTGKILITTRVLDVGVSIKNSGIPFNIVIYESDDIVECLQCLGRKRLVSDSEQVTAYFYAPDISDIKASINSLNHKENLAKKMVAAIENQEYQEHIECPVFIHGNRVHINSLFFKKNDLDRARYQQLYDMMSNYKSSFEQRKAYALWLLSNFENIKYEEDELFLVDSNKVITKLLNNCLGNVYSKDEFKEISNQIKELHRDIRTKESENAPGIIKVNQMITLYGFEVISAGNPKTYTFKKKEAESDVQ